MIVGSCMCVIIKSTNLDLFGKKSGVFASKGNSACSNLPLALMVLLIRVRLSSLMVFFTSTLTLILFATFVLDVLMFQND